MKRFFQYWSYKDLANDWILSQPSSGHGQRGKLAKYLRIQPSMLSQILRGDKHLSAEQAIGFCQFLGLTDLQANYFMDLVAYEKAGSHQLKSFYRRRITDMRVQEGKLSEKIIKDANIHAQTKTRYFGNWYHSAIRVLTDIREFQDVGSIAARLKLPHSVVQRSVNFLLKSKLCVEHGGRIKMGPAVIYVEPDTDEVSQHHRNWRLKAIERIDSLSPQELALTMPASLSKADIAEIRSELVDFIAAVTDRVRRSTSEEVYCLNIDWFQV